MLSTAQSLASILFRHSSRRFTIPFRTIPNRALSTTGLPPEQRFNLDPYNYTGGRWLCDEETELQLRHINFDFSALCQKILSLSNANSISSCEKIEGGSNRVFVFTLENGQRTVAKLPFKIAGPVSLTTASEVATVRYLQQKRTIPIPELLDWSADASNNIGGEYIISEHAPGTNLHFKWPDMTDAQRVKCITNIYRSLKDLEDITFPAYGSIYFADTDLTSTRYSLDNGKDQDFIIGPHCGHRYWDCHSTTVYSHHGKANQGPWQTITEYTNAQIETGLAKLPTTSESISSDPKTHLSYQGTIPQHLSLLTQAQQVLHKMCTDPLIKDYSSPLLFHPDLHKRNIFVSDADPGIVTAIIDWQRSAVEPAFWYRWDVPDYAGMKLVRPYQVLPWLEHEASSEKAQEQEQEEKQEPETQQGKDKEEGEAEAEAEDAKRNILLSKTYSTQSLLHLPTLSTPKYIHENVFRPFVLPRSTWSAGLAELHHELIHLRKDWTGLGFDGSCPFPEPSEAELEKHKEDYETYKTVVKIRELICESLGVGSDGFVNCGEEGDELWGERVQAAREIREMLRGLLEQDEEVKDVEMTVRAVWPLDVDL